jgi:hypothetical protein
VNEDFPENIETAYVEIARILIDNHQVEFLMKITQLSMIALASCLSLTGCSKKSGKSGNGAPSRPAVSQEANERAERVVPADFVNNGSSVDDVKDSLTSQTETIKGPGANLGLDQTSSPKKVVKTLTGKGLISKAAKSVMNSEASFSLAGPVKPGSSSASSKGMPSLDTDSCDSFFSSIDQVIDSGLKTVRSSLASVNEEEILKMEGVSKGEKLPNEAFRYNIVDVKEGAKASLSGGSNDTSAFIKVSGEAKFTTEITATEEGTEETQFPDDSSENLDDSSFLAADPETLVLEGLLAMNAAILVDSKTQLMRVGGGIAFLGKAGKDPLSTKASTFVELAGGKTPGVTLEFDGELNGKLGAENPAVKMTGDYKFSLVQAEDKSFRSELKSSFSASNGKETEASSMTMTTEMGVVNGECVVKKIECTSVPSAACSAFNNWSLITPSL